MTNLSGVGLTILLTIALCIGFLIGLAVHAIIADAEEDEL